MALFIIFLFFANIEWMHNFNFFQKPSLNESFFISYTPVNKLHLNSPTLALENLSNSKKQSEEQIKFKESILDRNFIQSKEKENPEVFSKSQWAQSYYELGQNYLASKDRIRAIAAFRKVLYYDPLQIEVVPILYQLNAKPPLSFLFPIDLFFILFTGALFLLVLSINKWKIIFFIVSVFLMGIFGFFSYQKRVTIISEVDVKSAPHKESHVLFSLNPGEWPLIKSTEKNNWTQIKIFGKGTGWIPNSSIFEFDKNMSSH